MIPSTHKRRRVLLAALGLLALTLGLAPAGSASATAASGIKLRLAEPTVAADHVDLSWSFTGKPSGKLRFQVLRNGETVATTRKLTYTDEDVEVDETYSYRIRAISSAAGSRPALSNTVQATVAPEEDPEDNRGADKKPLPPLQLPTPLSAEKVNDDLGSGRTMSTWVTISRNTGRIDARTRIATTDFWVGFHGAVVVKYRDQAGDVIGVSSIRRAGVDGLIVITNQHDITFPWDEEIAPVVAQRIASVEIVHFTAPVPDLVRIVTETRNTVCTFWNLFSTLIGQCPVPEVTVTEHH